MKRGEFLKDRAERFFFNAKELFKRGDYDLCAFNVEQSAQLFLKYALWKKLGDFEKTHKLTVLLHDLRDVYPQKTNEIEAFFSLHKEVIVDLEMAYIESRYLPATFFKEQVEKMVQFGEELQKFLERL